MRRSVTSILRLALCLPLACSTGNGEGGCAGEREYEYPRDDPTAALTERTARVRLTQSGFDTISDGVPGLLAASCTTSDACDIADGAVKFVFSDPDAPLKFNVGSAGEIRGGAYMALRIDSMAGNVHMDLLPVADGPDGIQITLGCNADNFNDCFPTCACDDSQTTLCDPGCPCDPHCAFVEGSLDMDLFMEESLLGQHDNPPLSWADSVCAIDDRAPPVPGIVIESFRFTIYPRITLVDQRPYLLLENGDVKVDRMEIALDVGITEAFDDPVCADPAPANNCNLCGSANWIVDHVLETVLESNGVSKYLATLIARAIFGSIEDQPLDYEDELSTQDFLPGIANRRANPAGFRVSVNTESPAVTGIDALGMNFDVDSGAVALSNACVPTVREPSWTLPPTPDPGTTVVALDPITGLPVTENFDMAVMVSDIIIERAFFELFDGGSFCLALDADAVSELSGGSFVPTVDTLGLMIAGLPSLAPGAAPVDLWLVPRLPALITFGSGTGEGEGRDSHIQMVWPSLNLEVYPLVDETVLRALGFMFDLEIGLSIEATPEGNIALTIDKLALTHVATTYNEMGLRFSAEDIEDLVSTFLPVLLQETDIDFALTTAMIGFPFVPKLRAAGAADRDGRYLSVYFRFCMPDDITNPNHALCYEEPEEDPGASVSRALGVERIAGPGGMLRKSHIRVRAFTDAIDTGHLQIAYGVDDVGPMYSFRGPTEDGTFILEHPLLAVEGPHVIEIIGRDRRRPGKWTEAVSLVVVADHRPPTLTASRTAGGVSIEVVDRVTPTNRIGVAVEIDGEVTSFLPRTFVSARPEQSVILSARDDAGNVSEPLLLAGRIVADNSVTAPQPSGGCNGAHASWPSVLALVVLVWRRR